MLIDKILAYIVPHECLGCSAEGALLCSNCERYLIHVDPACYHCRKPTEGSRTCIACLPYSDLYAVCVATTYKAIAKDLIWHLKFNGTQAAATEIADQLARFVPRDPDFVLMPIPTASSRIRTRGYDQADLITRALAKKTGVEYLPALRRSGQTRQRGSNRDQRTSQLSDAYRIISRYDVRDRHVLLVDDVMTTGSTLEAAAKVLKAAGAKRVSGLVFARA